MLLDIAHNAASIEALVASIKDLEFWRTSKSKTLIMATSREKDAAAMLRPVMQAFDHIIFTKYQDNPRGRDAEELLLLAKSILTEQEVDREQPTPSLSFLPTPIAAWEDVRDSAGPDDFVCIAGSAFLVAELRPVIRAMPSPAQV